MSKALGPFQGEGFFLLHRILYTTLSYYHLTSSLRGVFQYPWGAISCLLTLRIAFVLGARFSVPWFGGGVLALLAHCFSFAYANFVRLYKGL